MLRSYSRMVGTLSIPGWEVAGRIAHLALSESDCITTSSSFELKFGLLSLVQNHSMSSSACRRSNSRL